MLIPSWQVEKCEGLCAEEAARHCEVLYVPSIRGRLIRVWGAVPRPWAEAHGEKPADGRLG